MRGINSNFSIMALALVFFLAVGLLSLPATAYDIKATLSLVTPNDDSYVNGMYLLNATIDTNLNNLSFYYINSTFDALIYQNTTSGTEFTYLWNTSAVSDGVYIIKANDTSGLYSIASTNITLDNNPPIVTLDYPVDSTTYTNTTLDLNYTAVDTVAVDHCWYNLNGVIIDLPGCANTTFTGIENYNTLIVYANDTTGLVGESSNITFLIDTTGPIINLLHPVDGENYSSTALDLNYTVSDISGLDHCWYNLNGVITDIGCVNSTILGSTGDNWLILYANDTVGNVEQTNNITLLIDDVDPLINIIQIAPIPVATGMTMEIIVNTTDNIDPNLTVDIDIMNSTNHSIGTYSLPQFTSDLYGLNFSFPIAESGNYNLNVTSTDFIGNIMMVFLVDAIEVDNTPPTLNNLLPNGSSTNRYPELKVTTDEKSTCRFDDENVSYENMTKTFGSIDSLSHIFGLGKSGYGIYTYYVRCKDGVGNVGDGLIEFTIVKGGSSGGGPSGPITYNKNFNETDITTDSNYTTEEQPETEITTDSSYITPEEDVIEEPTMDSPTGFFILPIENVSLTTIFMGVVIVIALSSLIFKKEITEVIDRILWRHY